MHEGGLATELLDAVLAAAAAHAPARITVIEVEAGERAVPSVEALAWHLERVAAGTRADGARLQVTGLPGEPWACRLTGIEVEDAIGEADQASRA